jgi:hypothetical protein
MRRWMVVLALVVLAAFLVGLRTGPSWTTGQTVTRPAHQTHVTR